MTTREKTVEYTVRMIHALKNFLEVKNEFKKFAVENEQEIKTLFETGDEELQKLNDEFKDLVEKIAKYF